MKTHGLLTIIAICMVASIASAKLAHAGTVINVRDFGAKGDGITDDTIAVNAAIAAGAKQGPGAKVFIPAGRYLLLHPKGGAHVHIDNAHGLILRGQRGTELMGDDPNAHIISFDHCSNTTIEDMTIEQDKYYFTQGTVVAQDSATHTIDLKLDPGYPELDAPQIVSIAHWTIHVVDKSRPGPYEGPPYFTVAPLSQTHIGDRLWRLTFSDFHGWPAVPNDINILGKKILVWDDRRACHGMTGSHDKDCLIQDVTYYGKGVNAGFFFDNCTGTMTFRRYVIGVPPGSNGLLSCSGGGQFIDIRGSLVFDHCDYQRFDDDGADIYTYYQRVHEQRAPRTIVVQKGGAYFAGDRLAILDWPAKQERTMAKIVAVSQADNGDSVLTLDRDVTIGKAGAGNGQGLTEQESDGVDRVVDYDDACASVTFRGCRFQCNRARPLNLKCRNCLIDDCDFTDCAGSPIEAGPEMWWGEAPAVHNLTIRNSRFDRNDSPSIDIGIFGDGEAKYAGLDNRKIDIEGNTFKQFSSHGAIRIRNADHVVIRNNTFGSPLKPLKADAKVLNITHCADVVTGGNTGL